MRTTAYKVSLLAACLSLAACALAQNAPAPLDNSNTGSSLGAVGRNPKGQNAPTKRVFTNDDMEVTNEPLPRLNLNISQADNSADVVAAILRYRQTHSPKQTEDTVHSWFDLYDRTLEDAIRGFNDHQSARQTSAKAVHEPCPTGEFQADCEKQKQTEWKNVLKIDPDLNKDNQIIGRVQSGLRKVRDGLRMNNVRYSWFTIRASNGYDTF